MKRWDLSKWSDAKLKIAEVLARGRSDRWYAIRAEIQRRREEQT